MPKTVSKNSSQDQADELQPLENSIQCALTTASSVENTPRIPILKITLPGIGAQALRGPTLFRRATSAHKFQGDYSEKYEALYSEIINSQSFMAIKEHLSAELNSRYPFVVLEQDEAVHKDGCFICKIHPEDDEVYSVEYYVINQGEKKTSTISNLSLKNFMKALEREESLQVKEQRPRAKKKESKNDVFLNPHWLQENIARLSPAILTHAAKKGDISVSIPTTLFTSLGQVSQNAGYYFNESEASKNCARDFLMRFWSDSVYVQATVNYIQEKTRLSLIHARATQSVDSQAVMTEAMVESGGLTLGRINAPCLSFLTAQLNGKKICFIDISGFSTDNLTIFLQQIEEFTKQSPSFDGYQFVFLNQAGSQNYSVLIKDLLLALPIKNAVNPYQSCTEKSLTSTLGKLFSIYGTQLIIEGVVNCPFDPISSPAELQARYPKYPLLDLIIQNSDQTTKKHQIPLIACCEANCVRNKAAIMVALKVLQDSSHNMILDASEVLQVPEFFNDTKTSPLPPGVANLLSSQLSVAERNVPPSPISSSLLSLFKVDNSALSYSSDELKEGVTNTVA